MNNENMKNFRRLQAQYAQAKGLSLEAYLVQFSQRNPVPARVMVLSWFEDHPSLVEVSAHCHVWYLTENGQPA